MPAVSQTAAASWLMTPSWVQNTLAPIFTASSAIGSTASERRNTSTMSTFSPMAEREGTTFWPRISVSVGLTGMTRYPRLSRNRMTPWLARDGSELAPTSAMVFVSRKMVRMVSSE